ncbi:MAG: hypothetical protein GC164_13275 [Phycisphaera sp.]|nr:hypothetical protein [Phycisphaera sp.]
MAFLNPWLLLGALGVGLPILAHLLNRYQVKRTDWAAMRFLNRSVRVRSRQLRLRDVLLLVMRCLALLCLVMAFARPAMKSAATPWLPGEKRAGVVIAIDASYSMAHTEAGVTRFARAIELAKAVVAQSQPGDPVSLVLLGGEHRVLLRNVAYDPKGFDTLLSEQTILPEPLDLEGVPKFLKDLTGDMDAPQKEVYILSDTQSRDWGRLSPTLRDAFRALGEEASVFVVPVGGGDENLAVTGLDLVSGTLRKGTTARYRATVHNFGSSPARDVEVRCRVDDIQIDDKRIPLIAAGSSETVSLFVPFHNAGPARITAEISGDALPTDDVRRVVAEVRERVSVLCVDGSSGETGGLVTSALLARADGSDDENYTVQTTQWPAFPTQDLDAFDVIILADVPEVTPEQAHQISRFVRRGHGLVWFAGDRIKADVWNRLSGDTEDALLPAKIGEAIDTRDSLGIGKPLAPDLPDHAVCRPLRSLPEDLLNETRFTRRLRVEPRDTCFPVLSLAGSHAPVLLEQSLGRGQVFMFTTSAQATWNNMALTPVFPMLMQQVVTYLAGREFEQPRTVGDSLALSYVEQPDASDAVFDTPLGQTITVPVREHRGQFIALLERSREAGFYVARVSIQSPGLPVAVNVDTRESDVACLIPARLQEQIKDTGVTLCTSESQLTAEIEITRTGRSYWRFFAMAALALLVLESLFADRILGRTHSRRSPDAQPVFQAEVA